MIEGPHLVDAALASGVALEALLVSEEAAARPEISRLIKRAAKPAVVLDERIFRSIVDTDTPQGIAAEIGIPAGEPVEGDSVFLEGVQDAGNVGTLLRSAAAFGITRVLHDRNCADPWAPKVLRAGAGAHFILSIGQAAEPPPAKLVCAVAHGGKPLREADLAGPLCWVFGAEGAGVSAELQAKAQVLVTIPVSRAVESLNVAAAAAICFHEAFSRRARGS
jgi:TrmH family RNA methyltransferase